MNLVIFISSLHMPGMGIFIGISKVLNKWLLQ